MNYPTWAAQVYYSFFFVVLQSLFIAAGNSSKTLLVLEQFFYVFSLQCRLASENKHFLD